MMQAISTQTLASGSTDESIATPTPTEKIPAQSERSPEPTALDIMIDGNPDDWKDFPFETKSDFLEDNTAGPDIREIRAFNSADAFFMALSFTEPGDFNAIMLQIDVDGIEGYDFTIDSRHWGGRFTNYGHTLKDGAGVNKLGSIDLLLGYDKIVEIKIPRRELDDKRIRKLTACTLVTVNEQPTWGDCIELSKVKTAEVVEREIPNELIYALKWGGMGALKGVLADTNYAFERIYDAPVTPFVVRVDPDGRILLLGHEANCLYELKYDGSVSLYATLPYDIWSFNFDHAGRLWIFSKANRYYWIDEQGITRTLTNGLWPVFTFDSQDNMYAIETNLEEIWKITPQGEKTLFAEGFNTGGIAMLLAVTPEDELLVAENYGNLVLVHQDGSKEVLTDQLTFGENAIGFGPDGLLYIHSWFDLKTFDLNSGKLETLDWYGQYRGHGGDFVLDKDHQMIVFHGNFPMIRVDLQSESASLLYDNRGETTALAVDQNHNVYAAYSTGMPNGKSTIYKILDGQLEAVLTVPYGWKRALAINPDGIGFFGVADTQKGGMIYKVNLNTGSYEAYFQPDYWPLSIAIEPGTGLPWWTGDGNKIFHMTATGEVVSELGPTPQNPQTQTLLSFAPDGTLYVFEEWQKLYLRTGDNLWAPVYEHRDGFVHIHRLAVRTDNQVYAAADNSGNLIPGGRDYGSTASIFTLDEQNNLVLIGYDFPFDIFSIDVDPINGDVYFSNSDGIFKLYLNN